MILDATTKSLVAKLAGSTTTQPVTFTTSWTDMSAADTVAGSTISQLTGSSYVTTAASPAYGAQRNVFAINAHNLDTTPVLLSVFILDSSTYYPQTTVTLEPYETLIYSDVEGWSVITSSGYRKTHSVTSFSPATTIPATRAITSSPYILSLVDAGCLIDANNTSTTTITVPAHADAAFPLNTFIFVRQANTGSVIVSPASGVTLEDVGGLSTSAIYRYRALIKLGTNRWSVL